MLKAKFLFVCFLFVCFYQVVNVNEMCFLHFYRYRILVRCVYFYKARTLKVFDQRIGFDMYKENGSN